MRRLVILVVGVLVWVAAAAPALAHHTHVLLTGNGSCVILAENSEGEYDAESGRHPLHFNVHKGQPGTRHGDDPEDDAVIWVKGSDGDADNCDGYVNE